MLYHALCLCHISDNDRMISLLGGYRGRLTVLYRLLQSNANFQLWETMKIVTATSASNLVVSKLLTDTFLQSASLPR